MKIVGDIHGNYTRLLELSMPNTAGPIIQIGDFGFGFVDEQILNDACKATKTWFIRGNHDSPEVCRSSPHWIPDGTVDGNIMFIGGAWSIDYAFRTPGVSWWADEELSQSQFEELLKVYEKAKPEIMFTHDAPIMVTDEMFIKSGLALGGPAAKQIPNKTNVYLQHMFDIHKPKWWFFGHWHLTRTLNFDGCQFVCIGENDWVDFDGEKITKYPKKNDWVFKNLSKSA